MHFRQNVVRAAMMIMAAGALGVLGPVAATAGGVDGIVVGSDRPQFSVNATVASDYRFRGFTQTRESTAVQGGFDIVWKGFYSGVWASNVDFGTVFDGTRFKEVADIEIVTYTGFKRKFQNNEVDLRAIAYFYPGNEGKIYSNGDLDYFELMAAFSREIHPNLTADLTIYYSPDYFGGTGRNWVFEGGLSRKLGAWGSAKPSLSARIAHSNGDESEGGFDYWYWNAGMSVVFANYFEFDIRYYDTFDVPTGVGSNGPLSCKNLCDGRVVARITFEN